MRKSRAALLKQIFDRNGYYRIPDEDLRQEKKAAYKKGYEIRFVAQNYKEYLEIRKLLKALGFLPGKAFLKGAQRVIPVYGKDNYFAFRELMKEKKVKKVK